MNLLKRSRVLIQNPTNQRDSGLCSKKQKSAVILEEEEEEEDSIVKDIRKKCKGGNPSINDSLSEEALPPKKEDEKDGPKNTLQHNREGRSGTKQNVILQQGALF